MAYDAASRLISITDRDGRVRNFGYDQLNRKTSETWLTSSGGSTNNLLTFTVDAINNLLSSADFHGTYTMAYDVLNRMTSELEPFGQSLNFQFDAVGNRIFVRDSNGGVTRSTYDAANRLTSRQFTGVGQTPVRADYTLVEADPPRRTVWRQELEESPFERIFSSAVTEKRVLSLVIPSLARRAKNLPKARSYCSSSTN